MSAESTAPTTPTPATADSARPALADDPQQRVWQSTALLGDECEAIIEHRGQKYRLRCTKQGKLILYK